MSGKAPGAGLIALFLLVTLAGCQRGNLVNRVKIWQDAANRHDLNGMEAMIADSAVFEIEGGFAVQGKKAIRAVHDNDAGLNTRMEFTDCLTRGNMVKCKGLERNDYLKAAGLNQASYDSVIFTFDGKGLIQKISATQSAASKRVLEEFEGPFVAWVQQNAPAEFAKVTTADGNYLWSRESAKIVVDLVKEFRTNLGAAVDSAKKQPLK